MEASPKYKSHTQYLGLSSTLDLYEFAKILEKCYNNPQKYTIINKNIETDSFGDPYTVASYKENPDEYCKPPEKYKAEFFSEIINLRGDLKTLDELVEDHWANTKQIVFMQDFTTKDKIAPIYYRVIIYLVPTKGNVISPDDRTIKAIKPVVGV